MMDSRGFLLTQIKPSPDGSHPVSKHDQFEIHPADIGLPVAGSSI
jgi:hypothetical protein